MKVLVGISGGVDSAVAAILLKQQGYEVIGANMTIWGERLEKVKAINNIQGTHGACLNANKEQDLVEAQKICDKIGIPFHIVHCDEQFENIVMENFKQEYLDGRTPNPCVQCNSKIKFGAFPELAKRQGIEFDKFATGHYAGINIDENGRYSIKRGINPKRDQSYFLYKLTEAQLKDIILPLGEYTKEEIREIAQANGLEVAQKPDSQDFYNGDYNDLLEVDEQIGNIVDESGKVLGQHKGFWNYTIGQRKGLGVSSTQPLYVLELRKETNEVVLGPADKTMKDCILVTDTNILCEQLPKRCTAKIRSTQQPTEVTLEQNGENIIVKFDVMQKSIAIGQSAVFYDNDILLGGGIISQVF